MPKIIVKVKHIAAEKSAKKYVNYIAQRDGVDKSVNREGYIKYMATRPGSEKIDTHGLFGAEKNVNIKEVGKEIEEHSGTIWMPIISLTREDAVRLGYDNAKAWRSLICSKQAELAKIFNIPLEDFKWYAAFHNEGYHPHIHMVVYSKKTKSGFITEKDIEKIKSLLANEIFKNEMYQLYNSKTKMREKLSDEVKRTLYDITENIKGQECSDKELCDMLFNFSKKLKKVKGKKVYGYLPKNLKNDVDAIVNKLSEDENIRKIYENWCGIQKKIYGIYSDNEITFPKLCDNREFKKIKNAIVCECEKIGNAMTFGKDESEDETETETEFVTEDGRENEWVEDEFQGEGVEKENRISKIDDGMLMLSAMKLVYRLGTIIRDDACNKIDGFNKTIVDSKEKIKEMKKKQGLGIKME